MPKLFWEEVVILELGLGEEEEFSLVALVDAKSSTLLDFVSSFEDLAFFFYVSCLSAIFLAGFGDWTARGILELSLAGFEFEWTDLSV